MFSDTHFVILRYYKRTVNWMKKIFASALLLVLAFTVVIPACKKYEEGPGISLRSKKERVANEWKYERVLAGDGAEQSPDYEGMLLTIKNDFTFSGYDHQESINEGTWKFGEKKKNIILQNNSGVEDQWLILRLTENEFWVLDSKEDGSTSEYHFIPN